MSYTIPARLIMLAIALLGTSNVWSHVAVGDTLQTLTNLHPNNRKNKLYSVNYQQRRLIPACEDITVTQLHHDKMVFRWRGDDYDFNYDRHTKKARVSFHDSLGDYFGERCDEEKIDSLRKIDQIGLEDGQPRIRMSKYGILFALGRPPHHANPDLGSNVWLYWKNKKRKLRITFDRQGFVTSIR